MWKSLSLNKMFSWGTKARDFTSDTTQSSEAKFHRGMKITHLPEKSDLYGCEHLLWTHPYPFKQLHKKLSNGNHTSKTAVKFLPFVLIGSLMMAEAYSYTDYLLSIKNSGFLQCSHWTFCGFFSFVSKSWLDWTDSELLLLSFNR